MISSFTMTQFFSINDFSFSKAESKPSFRQALNKLGIDAIGLEHKNSLL